MKNLLVNLTTLKDIQGRVLIENGSVLTHSKVEGNKVLKYENNLKNPLVKSDKNKLKQWIFKIIFIFKNFILNSCYINIISIYFFNEIHHIYFFNF